jgi:hypothetical protein
MTNNKQQTEINAVEYFGKVNQFAKENNTGKPKQQTAIEWLWNQLPEILPFTVDTETAVKLQKAYQQAKEIEKKIMIDAIIICEKEHYVHSTVYPPQFVIDKAEQYYNNKYGNDKQ